MKFKFIALSLCMVASVNIVKAQGTDKSSYQPDNRHEFRIAASDGLTLTSVDVLGMGIADALTGTKRSDEKATMVYSVGYRYALNRFRLGGDLGFAKTSSQLTLNGETSPSIKEKELNFLVLPTAEFIYFKRRLVELYGSASAGGSGFSVSPPDSPPVPGLLIMTLDSGSSHPASIPNARNTDKT